MNGMPERHTHLTTKQSNLHEISVDYSTFYIGLSKTQSDCGNGSWNSLWKDNVFSKKLGRYQFSFKLGHLCMFLNNLTIYLHYITILWNSIYTAITEELLPKKAFVSYGCKMVIAEYEKPPQNLYRKMVRFLQSPAFWGTIMIDRRTENAGH